MDRPKPLDPVEAYEAIQRLLGLRDSLSFGGHCRRRMRERCFTVDDIHRVLTMGTVSSNPEWDNTYQNWKYRVSGRDCDNVPLVMIVALEPGLERITIITGIDD